MGLNKINLPKPEEMARIHKARALSDAELIKGGAEYAVDESGRPVLEPSEEQQKEIKQEMESGKIEKIYLAIPDIHDVKLEVRTRGDQVVELLEDIDELVDAGRFRQNEVNKVFAPIIKAGVEVDCRPWGIDEDAGVGENLVYIKKADINRAIAAGRLIIKRDPEEGEADFIIE